MGSKWGRMHALTRSSRKPWSYAVSLLTAILANFLKSHPTPVHWLVKFPPLSMPVCSSVLSTGSYPCLRSNVKDTFSSKPFDLQSRHSLFTIWGSLCEDPCHVLPYTCLYSQLFFFSGPSAACSYSFLSQMCLADTGDSLKTCWIPVEWEQMESTIALHLLGKKASLKLQTQISTLSFKGKPSPVVGGVKAGRAACERCTMIWDSGNTYLSRGKKIKTMRQKEKITPGSAEEAGSLLGCTVLQVTKVKHMEFKEIAPNHNN